MFKRGFLLLNRRTHNLSAAAMSGGGPVGSSSAQCPASTQDAIKQLSLPLRKGLLAAWQSAFCAYAARKAGAPPTSLQQQPRGLWVAISERPAHTPRVCQEDLSGRFKSNTYQ